MLVSGTPLCNDLHRSVAMLLSFMGVQPWDREGGELKRNGQKMLVDRAYDTSIRDPIEQDDDGVAKSRLANVLSTIMFRHCNVSPLKLLVTTMQEITHVAKPCESERYMLDHMHSVFTEQVVSAMHAKDTHVSSQGSQRRLLENVKQFLLKLCSDPSNVCALRDAISVIFSGPVPRNCLKGSVTRAVCLR